MLKPGEARFQRLSVLVYSPDTCAVCDAITLKHIILTAISRLLNLYAKKFRCPDVLTSIFAMFTLMPDLYSTSKDQGTHDAQTGNHRSTQRFER
ncbi:hypothetical protein D8M09_06105 [Enterobacter sp. R1(2018)]|nr:hypothetical protein D8M09_06105 [Enterobacter sp. R1(2018)]